MLTDAPPPDAAPVTLPPGIAEMADQARAALTAQLDGIVAAVVRQAEAALQTRYKADLTGSPPSARTWRSSSPPRPRRWGPPRACWPIPTPCAPG